MSSRSASLWTRVKEFALGFDAWLNAALFDAGRSAGAAYERVSERLDKLSVHGFRRVILDLSSEAVTLGLGGGVVMLTLAQPAFRETTDNWLKSQELAVTFLDRYGQEVGRRGIKHDDSVKLDDFPDQLIKAVVATEDRRFYEHWGIDPIGTLRALTVNARGGGVVQGGSSLTQQLAKNLFLSNERSLERKVNEAFLALWLEFHLTKNEILKLYLDRAYMGGGTFGAAAAADYYFGKSVKDLTLAEAAMMAGLFKAPTKYAPHVNLPAARARASDVLNNMVEAGFLSEGQIQTARRNPATPVNRGRDVSPDYYLDWAFDEIKRMAQAGKIGNERVLIVKTPLDISIQRRAEQTIENVLRQYEDQYDVEQGAMVVMDPDGAVRAMVGGRDYGQSQFNRATDALRQPGSSFKPYVYAAALTYGKWRPNSIVVDAPICIGTPAWCPQNYGHSFAGAVPLVTAVAKSINTIPVLLSRELGKGNAKVGRALIIDMAKKMGLNTELKDSTSLPIGSAEVTVLDQTAAYAVFANGGKRARPYAAYEIRTGQGETVYRRDRDEPPSEQVLQPRVVADMNFMLSKVVEEGTGKRAAFEGARVLGKTGTTNAYRDAWFVGYTGNLVSAVWFGNDDHTSAKNMTGGTLPAMAWHEVMSFAHQNVEIRPVPYLDSPPPPAPVAAGPGRNGPAAAAAQAAPPPSTPSSMPGALSRRSFEVIGGIGDFFKNMRPAAAPASFSPPGRAAAAIEPAAEPRPAGSRTAIR
jgi:penicillin-binding protein 1A